jgi:hypothetical protein
MQFIRSFAFNDFLDSLVSLLGAFVLGAFIGGSASIGNAAVGCEHMCW